MSDDSSNDDNMIQEDGNIQIDDNLENEGEANIQEEFDNDAETQTFNIETKQKQGDRTCATYCFKAEDHTLGNLLRFVLIKNPDVEFCGYSISHPSESDMNLRLQTTGKGSNRVITKGLKALRKVIDTTENKFNAELERFRAGASKTVNSAKRKSSKKKVVV